MKDTKFLLIQIVLLFPLIAPVHAPAEVVVAKLISDGVVFQRDQPIRVWGRAEPGELVAVELQGRSASVRATGAGRWSVDLAPLAAGGPYVLSVRGKNRIEIKDVQVGEVWIASGQSNMEWRLEWSSDASREIAASQNEQIRVFKVKRAVADEPQSEVSGEWRAASPKTAGAFTAVGYHFAKQIRESLGVPVGIIDSTWGGSPGAAWVPGKDLQNDPDFGRFITRFHEASAGFPERYAAYQAAVKAWGAAVGPAPTLTQLLAKPPPPVGPGHSSTPGGLYHGMIAPLTPMRVRGAIWYQGESDVMDAAVYRKLFPTLIQSWRRAWQQDDFPFLYVQLANFGAGRDTAEGSPWAELREAQREALAISCTGMVVTIDIGDAHDIHPRNKREVGRRLSFVARNLVYGEQVEASGPTFAGAISQGPEIRLRFTHQAGGLASRDGAPLRGFMIAGDDRHFVPASARIDGNEVVVSGPTENPAAVRYAWSENPDATLVNGAGLPASPFRTDDWPLVTEPVREP